MSSQDEKIPGNICESRACAVHSVIIPWLLITLIYILLSVISFTVLAEDAYISFRYADNIADGYGPVFNPGGEAVEGYSNPLWVGLLALAGLTGIDVPTAGRCLGMLFSALCFLEILLISRVYSVSRGISIAAALVLMSYPPFLFWGQAGLENGLYLYLLLLGIRMTSGVWKGDNLDPKSALPFLMLALTRPEGILYFIIIMAIFVILLLSNESKLKIKDIIVWSALVLIPFLIFLAWRYSIFHEWVPNTFFAKVNNGLMHKGNVGLSYISLWIDRSFWIPLAVPAILLVWQKKTQIKKKQNLLIFLVSMAIGQLLFILYAGGDIHPHDRFMLPVYVFALLIVIVLLEDFQKREFVRLLPVLALAALFFANFAYHDPPGQRDSSRITWPFNFLTANISGLIANEVNLQDQISSFIEPRRDALDIVGYYLASRPEISGLLATDQCGKIPYHSGLETLDLFGLNDTEIARIIHGNETWDIYAEEVINRAPETFVVFVRDYHLISRYYLENTVLSQPFRDRYVISEYFPVWYEYRDISGKEIVFNQELVMFRPREDSGLYGQPLNEMERTWLREHQPIAKGDTYFGLFMDFIMNLPANSNGFNKIISETVELN